MDRKILLLGKNDSGVTLMELIVALSIFSILIMLAAVGPEFTGAERVSSAAKELLTDLQWIRYSAMTQNPDASCPELRGTGVRFESSKRYRLFRFNDNNGNFTYDGANEERSLTDGEAEARQRNLSAPLEMKIKRAGSLVNPNNAVVLFDHSGMPRQTTFGFQKVSIVFQHSSIQEIPKRCVSISFNRVREGIWNDNECQEQ